MKKYEKIKRKEKINLGKALCFIRDMSDEDIDFIETDGKVYIETDKRTLRALTILLEQLINESRNKNVQENYVPIAQLRSALQKQSNFFLKKWGK